MRWMYLTYLAVAALVALLLIYTTRIDHAIAKLQKSEIIVSSNDKTQSDEITRIRNRLQLLERETFGTKLAELEKRIAGIEKRHFSQDSIRDMGHTIAGLPIPQEHKALTTCMNCKTKDHK